MYAIYSKHPNSTKYTYTETQYNINDLQTRVLYYKKHLPEYSHKVKDLRADTKKETEKTEGND